MSKLLKVPIFKQLDDSLCGPTCLQMVLAYLGASYSQQELAELCDHTYELGCSNLGIEKAAKLLGFHTLYQEHCGFSHITYYLDKAIPVIVDCFMHDDGHSVVVNGINNHTVFYIDPLTGQQEELAKHDFMRLWFDWEANQPLITSDNLIPRAMLVVQQRDST